MNSWIEKNYQRLREITSKISKLEDIDELFQFCIEQLLLNKKVRELPEQERFYFFVGIVKNNFYSKSSPYAQTYHRFKFEEFKDIEIEDSPYQDTDELVWVYRQIQEDKQKGLWYYARLFELFISQGCSISKTHKKTTIPLNSVSRDVNKYRKILKERRKNKS